MSSKFTSVKDSGKRQEFNTGSKRDTNEGKPRFDLFSPFVKERVGMHLANGATKYGDRNWEKGQPLSRYLESLERHLNYIQLGDESEDHESAVIWNMMAFMHTKEMIERGVLSKELNNLPSYNKGNKEKKQ